MSQEELRQAFELMKQGNKSEAIVVVRGVLQDDMTNVNAWLLMANLLDDERKKRKALERVLAINSEHPGALKMMRNLDGGGVATEAGRAPASPDNSTRVDKAQSVNDGLTPKAKYDWSKLEQRERVGFEPTNNIGSLRNSFGGRLVIRLALLIIFAVLSPVFYFLRDRIPTGEIVGAPPAEVALIQLSAAFNGDLDTMRSLTCTSLQDEWEAIYNDLQSDADRYGISGFQFDVSNIQATVTEQTARRTVVELTGELGVSADGEKVTINIEELLLSEGSNEDSNTMVLIVQNNQWVVCST
jgi:hypothetical protein